MKALAVGLCVLVFGLVGCVPANKKPRSPKIHGEAQEYDCKRHAVDKICEVPWKDRIVLYCHAKKVPRVVRLREECK